MTPRSAVQRSAEADPEDGRDETVDEQMDRNWNEMLQELRVTQTGTQILTGFLLAIAFQNRFAELDRFQQNVYLGLVLAAVLTTTLGLAPVNLHRVLFRQHAKQLVVGVAHVLLRLTLGGVGVVATDRVAGQGPGGGGSGAVIDHHGEGRRPSRSATGRGGAGPRCGRWRVGRRGGRRRGGAAGGGRGRQR